MTKIKNSKKSGVYIEKIGGKRVYNGYRAGKLLDSIPISKLKNMKLFNVREIFKRNNSFIPGIKKDVVQLKNIDQYLSLKRSITTETGNFIKSDIQAPDLKQMTTKGGEKLKMFQYVVQYTTPEGMEIAARSKMYGREPSVGIMRDEAYKNFYKRLHAFYSANNYTDSQYGDINKGRAMVAMMPANQRNNIYEGYVYFK